MVASPSPPLVAEAGPFWPLVLILAEIAERVARQQAAERADGGDGDGRPAPDGARP